MTNQKKTIGVGIIGCGNISDAYFNGTDTFEVLNIVSCADINKAAAQEKAEARGCLAQTVDELLANPDIDLVINLTIPAAHAEVSLAALNAGKHVHCEKPLAVTLEDGKAVLDLAAQKGLLVGCAPDTFLGAGFQTCRKLIDDQWLGKIIGGTAFMMSRGPESWHPNPAFFYETGAGPLFDMGPYYITALVHLLGPVKSVTAVTSKAFENRIATSKEAFGQELPVQVPTHNVGILEFHSGATLSMTISFDIHQHGHSPIEIYGTEGSLKAPDPNTFDGPVELWTPTSGEWKTQALSHPYSSNMRSIGAADIAYSILSNGQRKPRSSGALAYHTLEVMCAFEQASDTGREIIITSRPEQPCALPLGLIEGRLGS
jgi:predicted dehydrogenase